jgi:hypothetical protein
VIGGVFAGVKRTPSPPQQGRQAARPAGSTRPIPQWRAGGSRPESHGSTALPSRRPPRPLVASVPPLGPVSSCPARESRPFASSGPASPTTRPSHEDRAPRTGGVAQGSLVPAPAEAAQRLGSLRWAWPVPVPRPDGPAPGLGCPRFLRHRRRATALTPPRRQPSTPPAVHAASRPRRQPSAPPAVRAASRPRHQPSAPPAVRAASRVCAVSGSCGHARPGVSIRAQTVAHPCPGDRPSVRLPPAGTAAGRRRRTDC